MKIISTEIKNLEPIKMIAISHVGEYSGIGPAFCKLAEWAGANNLWADSPKMAGIYHDDPMHTPAEKLRSEACLEDLTNIELGEGMMRYTTNGGKYFVMQVEMIMDECGDAWKRAYTTFNEDGYQYDVREHYDLYISCTGNMQDPGAPWIVDLCIPMK